MLREKFPAVKLRTPPHRTISCLSGMAWRVARIAVGAARRLRRVRRGSEARFLAHARQLLLSVREDLLSIMSPINARCDFQILNCQSMFVVSSSGLKKLSRNALFFAKETTMAQFDRRTNEDPLGSDSEWSSGCWNDRRASIR